MPFAFTDRLVLLLALGLIPAALGSVLPGLAWGVVAYDLALVVAGLLDVLRTPSPAGLRVERTVADPGILGRPVRIGIRVENPAAAATTLAIRDEATAPLGASPALHVRVPARGTVEAAYELAPPARGAYAFAAIHIRAVGPWGLGWRRARHPLPGTLRVVPGFTAVTRYELEARRAHLHRTGLLALRRRGEGRTFASLREYVPGDEVRWIDWKATARRGKLIVREYEAERSQNVMLLLDAGRMMTADVGGRTKLDHAIDAALLLAYAAVRHGDQVGLLAFGETVVAYLPPKRGRGQLREIRDAVAGLAPELVEPDYGQAFRHLAGRRLQRALVVLFTDLTDARASRPLLRHLAGLVPRHLPLLVAIADPPVAAAAESLPADVGTVYRQAVALELLRAREEALRTLTARGGLGLDVAPGALDVAAVNRYLEVKARGLL